MSSSVEQYQLQSTSLCSQDSIPTFLIFYLIQSFIVVLFCVFSHKILKATRSDYKQQQEVRKLIPF
jgi:hypothetical protein